MSDERVTGHVIGGPADPDYDGAVLTTDVALGDIVIHVDDVADFDEESAERDAKLIIGLEFDSSGELDSGTGTPLAYTTCDDDAGTVTLAAASTVTASAGDRVYIEDPVSGYPVGRLEVMVAVDDGDSTGDALSAFLDIALLESVGDVDLTDLAVDLEEDEDGQLYVHGFRGLLRRQGSVKAMQDQTTAIGSGGSVTLDLTYIPVLNSEHLYWNGVYQPGSEWSRDAWTVTIPDPDGVFEAGDELVMEYLYTDPATAPPSTYGGVSGHLRAGTWGSHPSSFITSQALPTGTALGDLLVAVAVGDGAGGATIGDPRMTTIATGGNRVVAIGYATDLSDIVCNVGGQAFSLDQFAGIEVVSIQGDGSGPLEFDPARIAILDLASGATVGSVGGTGHGVIAAIAGAYASPIAVDMATDMPGYTDWGGTTATSAVGNFAFRLSEPPPSQTNPTNATDTLIALIGLR